MRIGIDARCLAEGVRTGVEEYTVGFIKRLLEQDSENTFVLFFNSFKKNKLDIEWIKQFKNVEIKNYGFPNKIFNLSIWLFGWPKIDTLIGGVDVFFAPNISFLALSKKVRFVLTVHDLSFERFPEFFSLKRRIWHFILNPRKICHRANKILAVSHSTKNDLFSLYRISKKKIDVVAPQVDYEKFLQKNEDFSRESELQKKYQLPENFLLFLGTVEPRKNIIALVKAFEALMERKKVSDDLKLVIAGKLGWSYAQTISEIKKSPWKKSIVLTNFIDDKDKPELYRMSKVFLYPSFFEGYGFPPAEAMASGAPVVTSNCSSIPEVVQDAALLIDPYRPFDITLAVEILLGNKKVYNEYKRRSLERAKKLKNNIRKIKLFDKLKS